MSSEKNSVVHFSGYFSSADDRSGGAGWVIIVRAV